MNRPLNIRYRYEMMICGMFASNTEDTKGSFRGRMFFPTGFPIPMLHRGSELPEGTTTSITIMIHVTKDGKELRDFDLAYCTKISRQSNEVTGWGDGKLT